MKFYRVSLYSIIVIIITEFFSIMEDLLFKSRIKLNRLHLNLDFLLACRDLKITPKFLKLKFKNGTRYQMQLIFKTEQLLLSNYIKNLRTEIFRCSKYVKSLNFRVVSSFDPIFLAHFFHRLNVNLNKQTFKIRNRHNEKLAWLIGNVKHGPNGRKSIPFLNFSSRIFTPVEKFVLTRGPNFIFNSKIPTYKIAAKFEKLISNLPLVEAEKCRALTFNSFLKNNFQPNFVFRILKNIKSDPSIFILSADKSSQIVFLEKTEFDSKVSKVLDELNAKLILKDPTNMLLSKLTQLKKNKDLPSELKENIHPPLYPGVPQMFFKIKIHKKDKPLRPLVACYKSPLYFLMKALLIFLRQFISESEYSVKSTVEFVQRIKDVKLSPQDKFYSFDIISLYPSVPLAIAIQIILEQLKEFFSSEQLLAIESALSLCLFSSYFKILGKIFLQQGGSPIGSPFSVFIAEICVKKLEVSVFAHLILKPKFFCRYIDDTLIIWSYGEDELLKMFTEFNNVFQTIKFTMEKEENLKINFLDLTLIRQLNGDIGYCIYRKPSSLTYPIPVDSFTPFRFKKSFFFFYFRRAFLCTSNAYFREREIKFVFNLGLRFGYSFNFLDKILKIVESKINSGFTNLKTLSDTKGKKFFSVYFQPNLHKYLLKLSKTYNFNITYNNRPSLFQLIRKDRDINNPIGGVYKIPLKFNNDTKYYIGKTKRNLNKRIQEHKYDLRISKPSTELARSVLFNNGEPVWEKAEIVSVPSTQYELNFNESLEIIKSKFNKPDLIVNESTSFEIPYIWAALPKKI